MIKIPIVESIPQPPTDFSATNYCGGCAYKHGITKDEFEMGIAYYNERITPHPCHVKKNGSACFVAMEQHRKISAMYVSGELV